MLLLKILPLYGLILLGFLAGKFLKLEKEKIAILLIYFIAPVIVFKGVMRANIMASNLSLPLLFLVLGILISLSFLFLSKFIWQDSTRNIIAFTSGTGNTGYFGLPVALALFGDEYLPLMVLALLGTILYENSLGFYLAARGNHSKTESFQRLLKLPAIYAFLLALALNLAGVKFGNSYENVTYGFQLAYTLLGMMIIGLGIASMVKIEFDLKFISVAFLARFLVWPLSVFCIIFLNNAFFHFYGVEAQKIMILMSIVPLAANTVSYATLLKIHPEKAAMTVLLSTIFALFYIPVMVMVFIK
jgi:predicted permease